MDDISGYLENRSRRRSVLAWKKRYFVLNGCSLYYKECEKKVETKGRLLLSSETVVRPVTGEATHGQCFEVVTEYETLRVSAESASDAERWISALRRSAESCRGGDSGGDPPSAQGYVCVKKRSLVGETWARKFAVVTRHRVAYYADHTSARSQGHTPLGASIVLQLDFLAIECVRKAIHPSRT